MRSTFQQMAGGVFRGLIVGGVVVGGVLTNGWLAAQAPKAPAKAAGPAAKIVEAPKAGLPNVAFDESLRNRAIEVQKMLRDGSVARNQEEIFDGYYKNYALARWVQPNYAGQLPKLRGELIRDLRLAKRGNSHNRLTDLAVDFLSKVASAEYDPVVRCNAMLAIGEMNREEAARANEEAKPLDTAVPVLLKAVQDPKQIEPVKVAAMAGLLRHAQLGIDDEIRREVVANLIKLATSPAAVGASPQGSAWMRAQAADVLGRLKSVGEKNAVVDALGQLAASAEAPVMARIAAARALASLDYTSAQGLASAKLAGSLGQAAVAVTRSVKADYATKQVLSSRKMKPALSAVSDALEALAKATKDAAAQQSVKAVRDQVEKLAAIAGGIDLNEEQFALKVMPLADELAKVADPLVK